MSGSKKSKKSAKKETSQKVTQRKERRFSSDERHLVIPDGHEYPYLLDVINASKSGMLVHAATSIKLGHKVLVIRRTRKKFSVKNILKQEPLAVYKVRWCEKLTELGYFWGLELAD